MELLIGKMSLFNYIIRFGLPFLLWVIILIAFYIYLNRNKQESSWIERNFLLLILILLVGFFIDASLKTLGQYYIWNSSPITQVFLTEGLKENSIFQGTGGYFLFYVITRFWIKIVASILGALFFGAILTLLKKKKERFFDVGEVKLGILTALIVGWPFLLFYVPLVFGSVILVSLARLLFTKNQFTSLGFPFLIACVITLILSSIFPNFLNIYTLKI